MPINITMPALSPTMEEGNLAKWLVKEGDKVSSGDVIAEIETDKATMEVEAVDEGTVAKLVVPAGTEGVKVNAVIAVLAAEGEDVSVAAAGNGAAAPAAKAEARRRLKPLRLQRLRLHPRQLPLRLRLPRCPHLRRPTTAPSPRRSPGGLPRKPASMFPLSPAPARTAASSRRTSKRPSPVAAKAGRGGCRRCGCTGCRRQRRLPRAPSDEAVLKNFAEGSYELVPHDGMRKTIAKRLHGIQADDSAFLCFGRLRARCAAGAARPAQRCGAEERMASRPTSSRSTTWSSRPWRWRCATCRTPTSPGPTATWSSTSTPMSASLCRSRAA